MRYFYYGLIRRLIAVGLALLFTVAAMAQDKPEFAQVIVNQTLTLQVEIATTLAERQRGLSNRHTLPADKGMMFRFAKPRRICLWMKNTYIPLLAAFVDAGGAVITTTVMRPHSEKLHCADNTAWALEMRAGVVETVKQLTVIGQ